jgi:hypothetical protein
MEHIEDWFLNPSPGPQGPTPSPSSPTHLFGAKYREKKTVVLPRNENPEKMCLGGGRGLMFHWGGGGGVRARPRSVEEGGRLWAAGLSWSKALKNFAAKIWCGGGGRGMWGDGGDRFRK